ncbi:MAG: DUF2490 domain-containing protein [Betaproteobacteria bacterium]
MIAPPAPERALASALAVAALLLATPPARGADQQASEFWPELNATVRIDEQRRLFLLATLARARDYPTATEATWGVHYDWFAAQLPRRWVRALPEMEQRWGLWFRFGYNRIDAMNGSGTDENRLLADATLRSQPLLWGLQFADRSRIEYRDIGDRDSWRYRNRLRVERAFATGEPGDEWASAPLASLGVASCVPYAMLEWFYDSRVAGWNRRYLQVGVEFELDHGWGLELYLARQSETRPANSTVNALGAVVAWRF